MSALIQGVMARKREPPQYDYMFRVEMPFQFAGGGPELNHRVYNINSPFRSFDTFKNIGAGQFFYTAAHSDTGSLSLKIEEMEDGRTLHYLMDWMGKIRNSDGTYNPPMTYYATIKLIFLDSSGNDLRRVFYTNCFPIEITPTSWSYDNSNVQGYEVNFSYSGVTHV